MTRVAADEQLMERVRKDDDEALREIHDRYRGPLFSFFFARLGEADPAEDLVQSVFIRAWKYRRTYRPGRPLRPWLFRMARNALADNSRTRDTESLPADVPLSDPDPEERLEKARLAERVRSAVARLPATQRDALLMSRWSGMSYRDIGLALNCSEGAVKLRVFRALETLRAQLASPSREA